MKRLFLINLFVFICFIAVSQRISRDSKGIQYLNYPAWLMPNDVKTFSTSVDLSAVEDLFEEGSLYVWTHKTITSILAPQGFTYKEKGGDIEIKLIANEFLSIAQIVDQSSDSESSYYLPQFSIPLSWEIVIDGAVSKRISLADFKEKIDVVIPIRTVGGTMLRIEEVEKVAEIMEEQQDQMNKYVQREFLTQVMAITRSIVNEQLSYKKQFIDVPFFTLRSNRQVDVSDWEAPSKKAESLLDDLSQGAFPDDLYIKYEDVFDFYTQMIEQYKDDPRSNRNLLEAASNNLVHLLLLVNPDAILDEYVDLLSGSKSEDKIDLKNKISNAKLASASRRQCTRDYAGLFKLPPLTDNAYEVIYTNSSGQTKPGVITFSTFYGVRSSDACVGFSLFDLDVYTNSNGQVSSRQAIDTRNIDSYEIFGDKYVKVRFNDPTVVALRGEESFMWELVDGDLSMYWFTDLDRSGVVVKKGNRGNLVFNYSRLAEMLEDKPEIAGNIRSGHYGNPPIGERTSRLGNMMQQGVVNDICPKVLLSIVDDYNKN